MIPNGSLTNEKIRDEKTLYEDILILSEKSDWSKKETPTALMSQAVISFVSKWGHQHKWILFGDRNSTNFLNSGAGFKVISDHQGPTDRQARGPIGKKWSKRFKSVLVLVQP